MSATGGITGYPSLIQPLTTTTAPTPPPARTTKIMQRWPIEGDHGDVVLTVETDHVMLGADWSQLSAAAAALAELARQLGRVQ